MEPLKRSSLTTVLVVLTVMANLVDGAKQPISCVDDDGNPVDWAIVYKFPTLRKQGAPFNSGWAYASLTSEDIKEVTQSVPPATSTRRQTRLSKAQSKPPQLATSGDLNWDISSKLLTDPNSLVIQTLKPVFGGQSRSITLSHVFYSDQPPTGSKPGPGRGHAKGVLMMDEQSAAGVWLIHTVPKFPGPRFGSLEFQSNSRIYAQTFMCISFNLEKAGEKIVNHLINLRPHVYDSSISPKILQVWPQTAWLEVNAFKGVRLQGEGVPQLAQVVSSSGGEQLALFSQSGEGETDMFAWLNKELQASLYVESWRNGVGKLESSCPNNYFHVNNVLGLKVEMASGERIEWSYRQDHSKWAISDSIQTGYVCLSDINRMVSQLRRGGGSVCMRCPGCWHLFSKSILEVEPCDLSGNQQPKRLPSVTDIDSAYDSGDDVESDEEMD